MAERKIIQSLNNLENALSRLEEAIAEDETNSLIIDGTIQRFEFTLELFWKTVKRILEEEGIESKTPRQTLKHAYSIGWIQEEPLWLQMLRDRNETSHVYDEEKAEQIYRNIIKYFPVMNEAFKELKDNFYQNQEDQSNDD